jgi:hypothetical protein
MHLWTLASLGIGVSLVGALAVWYFLRAESAADLGSISRNWLTEHRNNHE